MCDRWRTLSLRARLGFVRACVYRAFPAGEAMDRYMHPSTTVSASSATSAPHSDEGNVHAISKSLSDSAW
jgi:hypothetical protein